MTTQVQRARLQVTGHYAGAVSRAAAAALDAAIVFATYTAAYAGLDQLLTAFFNKSLSGDDSNWLAGLALASWSFVYMFGCLAIAGRTPGKAIVGLRVVRSDGSTVSVGRAFVRTLVFPLSGLLLGLGFLLIIVQREHRALHDLIAGTAVVYDWGDRPAEISGPLTDFLSRSTADRDKNPAG